MKIAFFDAKGKRNQYLDQFNNNQHEFIYFKENLTLDNIDKVKGFDAIGGSVNTRFNKEVLEQLHKNGVKFLLQRSMGYDNVDLATANKLGIEVFRVPNYSAESVAEMAVLMLLALNRNLLIANKRVSNYDFTINGLLGSCVHNSTVGVIGSGRIGQAFIKIIKAIGARILVFDEPLQASNPELAQKLGFEFVTFDQMLSQSDFISLHAPLLPSTKHIINAQSINKMKDGVIIINTARGEMIDTSAVLAGLKSGKIKGLACDVLEREQGRFFLDRSADKAELEKLDPEWKELIQMDNVLITPHYAYLTDVALSQIAKITLDNANAAQRGDFTNALKLMPDGKVHNG
ncbi:MULTISPECIES: NAD(P)-dependent oxidoreductase [unclassified Mycoplasma]|uniref:NAD(P)-dependent oxidoreductase n=1 Tax=unclassified Mycoplasma TaxID=2683645 RepID=UPI00211B9C5D|nr:MULTISPECIES: NAD(P)-dependent oxidoreductase [unclassified Mycoplasma]UUM20026.1 2-hydroxyacid dehydrogenase [Mycoplasma sp. 1578d]UUM25007.1 2-hydroxyacid dehydrogenase [Mycoplasma sp. 3686d]